MRIGFVFSFPALTGGHLAVLEIGSRLAARGHDVIVIYPRRSILSRRNELLRRAGRVLPDSLLAPLYRRNESGGLGWFDFPGRVLEVEELEEDALPQLDAVVATAWQTAERVARFGARTGRHVYFIQHHETWTGPAERVEETWREPFARIVSSAWLAGLVRERTGIDEVEVVPYGVDLEVFRPGPPRGGGPLRVGFLYHRDAWKGVADTLHAIREVSAGRELELAAFGVFPPGPDLPPGTDYRRSPSREELAALYASLDVFVSASWSETGPMTVPEAMACGTCVVATDVGNVSLWSAGGEGAVLVPPRRPDLLARELGAILDDSERRRSLAARGRELIQGFTWDAATSRFEAVLEGAA